MSGFATAYWTKFWKSGWSPSRGQKKPRGVKRKMSGYPLRGPGTVSCRKWDWTPQIVGSDS